MSMQLMPVYFNTYSSKKKSKKKNLVTDHQRWLEKNGLSIKQIKAKKDKSVLKKIWLDKYNDEMRVDVDYESAGMSGDKDCTVNRSILKKLHLETEQVQKEIINKTKRVAIAYNKGAYQYVTDGTDLTDVGKKK